MKVVAEGSVPVFKPVTITVTIESFNELRAIKGLLCPLSKTDVRELMERVSLRSYADDAEKFVREMASQLISLGEA